MPTETDLRDLLGRLAAGAPDADSVLHSFNARTTAPPRHPRRRAALSVAAAVAAVLVVAIALGAVFTRSGESTSAPVGSAPTVSSEPTRAQLLPAWHFALGHVPGFRLEHDSFLRIRTVNWVQEGATVTAVHGRVSGEISVQEHSPGGWAAQLEESRAGPPGLPTRIDGRPAYVTYGRPLPAGGTDPWAAAAADPEREPQLIWQLPDGAWAMVIGSFGFRPATADWDDVTALADLRRIAAAVRFGHTSPVRIPFRLDHDPAGLMPATVREFPRSRAYCVGYSTGRADAVTVDDKGAVLLVCRAPAGSAEPSTGDGWPSLVRSDPVMAERALPDGTRLLVIGSARAAGISLSAARALVRSADGAPSLTRASTWYALR